MNDETEKMSIKKGVTKGKNVLCHEYYLIFMLKTWQKMFYE